MIEDKQQQRQKILGHRDAMEPEMRERLSQKLVTCADLVMRQSTNKMIAGFWPIRSEIDPRVLMEALRMAGAKLALPALVDTEQFLKSGNRFSDKNCGKNKRLEQSIDASSETKTALKQRQHMIFRVFESDKDLTPMGFNTFGPGDDAARIDPDLILLPLAAFDKQGNRIGYGGGFYDRTITEMHERGLTPKLIGLAFDCQEIVAIAAEPHDIRLDAILTESGLRFFDKG